MLHLFDDLCLDEIIPKNNDRYRAIYGTLENKINTLYWPMETSIHKNNDADNRETRSYEMMQTENYRRSVGGA